MTESIIKDNNILLYLFSKVLANSTGRQSVSFARKRKCRNPGSRIESRMTKQ